MTERVMDWKGGISLGYFCNFNVAFYVCFITEEKSKSQKGSRTSVSGTLGG